MEYQKIHIGSLIKAEVKHRGMTFSEFAKRIGVLRQNVERKIFTQQGLDTELLIQISEVLDFDFFKYFQARVEREKLRAENTNTVYYLNGQTTTTLGDGKLLMVNY